MTAKKKSPREGTDAPDKAEDEKRPSNCQSQTADGSQPLDQGMPGGGDGPSPEAPPRPRECPAECPDQLGGRLQAPYRVFISYSHANKELAVKLRDYLRSIGLFAITDHEIRVGEAFSREIQEMIECAHVFMPLVTPSATKRLWVQQEIGYATALHVPLCPIVVDVEPPKGMIAQIQGIPVPVQMPEDGSEEESKERREEAMEIIRDRVDYRMLDRLVQRVRKRARQGRFDCAMDWSERQRLLISLTEAARGTSCRFLLEREARRRELRDSPEEATSKECGSTPEQQQTAKDLKERPKIDKSLWRMRQRTAFGSFSIPDVGIDSPVWDARDPDRYHSQCERRLLREERQAVDAYVECFGCDLILDPRIGPAKSGPTSGAKVSSKPGETDTALRHSPLRAAFRICLMMDFIEDHLEDTNVRVVIPKKSGTIMTNLIIGGDWFASEAVVPYGGKTYDRTMFTRHAPTVLNMIDDFDQDFHDCLAEVTGAGTSEEGNAPGSAKPEETGNVQDDAECKAKQTKAGKMVALEVLETCLQRCCEKLPLEPGKELPLKSEGALLLTKALGHPGLWKRETKSGDETALAKVLKKLGWKGS